MRMRKTMTTLLVRLFTSIIGLALVLILIPSTKAAASSKKQTAVKSNAASAQPQLGTSFRFSGSTLRGKYQTSMSLNASVENDKLLEDLLTGRTNFDDRAQQDQQRN